LCSAAAMVAALVIVLPGIAAAAGAGGCLACHHGIEAIRQPGSQMMEKITALGRKRGDAAGCTVCHGGDPAATAKPAAHRAPFYPDPGSPWINEKTCGRCHKAQVRAQWQSLMMTEAGKIQGTAWSGGGLEGYDHRWGNYDVKNPADPAARLGTDAYRAYKERLARLEPQVFPDHMDRLPAAPDAAAVVRDPAKAVFTYLREECERCHLAVRGRQRRGDYRGMGCSACHIPYGNEGRYEGGDPTISKEAPGHLLVHTIQATREAKVTVNGHTYSGIPVETCTTCHDRGKRIGTSFQGLMESAYTSPWGDGGKGQVGLHTKHYLSMKGDIHNTKYGMVCQDCHTTLDVHGDGFLSGTTLGSVEIECSDCHGTPERYPWELPLGYGDEFGTMLPAAGRGVARKLLDFQWRGTVYPAEDGYLLSARGNPLGNVVRRGKEVVVHTAGGRDLTVKPLKLLTDTDKLPLAGRVAMVAVGRHIDRLECYTCHAQWAPQCYGCHVKVDYSGKKSGYDWAAAGALHGRPGHRADDRDAPVDAVRIDGKVREQRSYLRWEDPALGVNGEGRITPIIPGCQAVYTVVGADGRTVVKDRIFRTPPFTEGGGAEGQLSIDTAPVQPHTNGAARPCESCHTSDKAAGYGIGGGRLNGPWDQGRVVDLAAPDGTILPRGAQTQIEPIPGLIGDWSRVVTEKGKQLQTVGHHFKGSRPLDGRERSMLERRGLCTGCHQSIPKGSLPVDLLSHVAEATGLTPATAGEHATLLHKITLVAAWAQVGGAILLVVALLYGLGRRRRSRRR